MLIQGARALGIPVVVTEQYPRGLGHTVPEVLEHLEASSGCPRASSRPPGRRASTCTAAARRSSAGSRPTSASARPCWTSCGAGVDVHVAADAVGFADRENRATGLHRMEAAGATLSSVEMALFELVGTAGTPEFKTVQGLVK